MHIFFSGIGGTAIGPLALIAKAAGFEVTGSDKQDSQYIHYLKKRGITDIYIGQTEAKIAAIHDSRPIDWYVYTSAVEIENAKAPELQFVREQGIKMTKRDEFINVILQEKHQKLLAIAGTHGKTTTTAMVIWLFKQLGLPISYSVGAKIKFGDMGQYQPKSEYFVYECDEFDRNFLAFKPFISLISGVTWDHHEIFPTREDYKQAFREFIDQSKLTILWQEDADYLGLDESNSLVVENSSNKNIQKISLAGQYNRLDAWLAIQVVHEVTNEPIQKLVDYMNKFPGSQRRMEEIVPGLYSDYAHTPEKIRAVMSVALETAAKKKQDDVVAIYEPLTNRRQHYMIDDYKDCFKGAEKVYWLPSYLAREDPSQRIIPPAEMITHLSDPSIAQACEQDDNLKKAIQKHLDNKDLVVAIAGGGGDSLDEWIRDNFRFKV